MMMLIWTSKPRTRLVAQKRKIPAQQPAIPPVVRFINKMLMDAIRGNSSDLHFEPFEKSYRVRFRTDGVLHEVRTGHQ